MKTFMGYTCPGAKSFNPSWLIHWRKLIIIKGLPTAFLNFLSLLYLSFSRAPFPKPPQMWRSMATAQWLQSTENGSISWEHVGSSQDRFILGSTTLSTKQKILLYLKNSCCWIHHIVVSKERQTDTWGAVASLNIPPHTFSTIRAGTQKGRTTQPEPK